MTPTEEQKAELIKLTVKLRKDMPILVNTLVPPEFRPAALRVMMAVVPPMYVAMELERLNGTSPSDARQCAAYATAVSISGALTMTTSDTKMAGVSEDFLRVLKEMLRDWAKAGALHEPGSKPH